jgi:CRISP-associated protein Cas1
VAEANEALRLAEDLCDGLGFTINDAKTSVAAFADVIEFLGEPISDTSPPSDPGADDAPPRRRTLYLTSRTVNVHLRQGQVRSIGRDGGLVASVPVSGLGRLVVIGPMNVSAGLRSHALLHDIDVVFLSRSGSWLGRYDSGRTGDVLCRIAQYRLSEDEERRLALSRGFVLGKIANQRALLQRYVRRRRAVRIAEAIEELGRSLDSAASAGEQERADGLRGERCARLPRGLRAAAPASALGSRVATVDLRRTPGTPRSASATRSSRVRRTLLARRQDSTRRSVCCTT